MRMKPVAKLIIILILAGLMVGGYMSLKKSGKLSKLVPEAKGAKVEMSDEVKKAIKDGKPVIRVAINTWGGYGPGLLWNGGLAANTESNFYTKDGVLVDIKVMDDFAAMRNAFKAGDIDVMGLATVDSYPCEADSLKEYEPQMFIQTDWSFGGDAIVVGPGIKSVKDLKGKKVACATGTPSQTLLILTLEAAEMSLSDINMVGVGSGVDSAQQFKAGAVDAAVVWSPDDEDCIKAVNGAKVLVNTKTASNVIADVLVAKKSFIENHRPEMTAFVKGWCEAAGEINTSSQSKAEAARVVANCLKVDADMAMKMLNNAKLTNLGDNKRFFGMEGSGGTKGEEIYNKMFRRFYALNLAPKNLPPWRNVVDTSLLSAVNISGPGQEAEGRVKFSAPTKEDYSAPAIAEKHLTVNYETGKAGLTVDGKLSVDEFSHTAKEFSSARIRIEGNTDSVGSHASNVALSKARANVAANYLSSKYGFDRNRFVVVGNGPDKPISDNDTPDGKAANRRTDFSIVK